MNRLLILTLILGLSASLSAQSFTLSGYITDENTGEGLIGANVVNLSTGEGTVTNTYGFYSISIPADTATIGFSYIGYQPKIIPLFLKQNMSLSVKLNDNITMDEIEVVAERIEKIEDKSQMSTIKVPIKQLKKIPAFMGEVDILKAIQLLPGVQSGGEGQSGFYVRGGSQDQNLILLDGTPVYNASHLFGFFSVFNADAIKDVQLVKGGFPARYGGRLSSVLEINMKEGNNQEYKGSATVGLISSKAIFEGPILKDKASFIVSARRTYIDILARPFISRSFSSEEGQSGKFGYYFYDLNAKLNWKISDKDRVFLSSYLGDDVFYTDITEEQDEFKERFNIDFGWGNATTAARWNHLWTDKLFCNVTLTYSQYNFGTQNGVESASLRNGEILDQEKFSFGYESGITDLTAKIDFDYLPANNHFVKFGASFTHHSFVPGGFNIKADIIEDGQSTFQLDTLFGQSNVKATEYFTYIEDDINITPRLKANVGLHFSGFNVNKVNFTSLQPRFSARYLLPDGVALKGSFATMQQYIQYLSNENIGLPWDQWLPTTENVRPQTSWQAAVGAAKTINGDFEISGEAYYKKMNSVTSYKEGASVFQTVDWQSQVTQGEGRSYGLEVFLQKKTGKLSGWVGYTLSWSDRRFDDKNFGRWYPFKFDRRHDISIVGIYELSDKINFSGTWIYGTGNTFTFPTSKYFVIDEGLFSTGLQEVSNINERNNLRLEPFHRLDLNVDILWKMESTSHKISIGAYNAYSRKNPFFVNQEVRRSVDMTGTVVMEENILKQYSLFPIIPSIAYSIDF